MEKKETIDEFLKRFKQIVEKYPDVDLNNKKGIDAIYKQLVFLNVKDKDKAIRLSESGSSKYNNDSVFTNWRHSFPDNKNLDVFRTPDHLYFCQFVSNDIDIRSAKDFIKIYIPLDAEHIEDGAKIIFKFIAENKMPHQSKISKKIRFDDIVVRLIEPSDVEKLLDFIKNNDYLQAGLIEPNPFAFQKDNIAMACDGRLSYNDTLSKLIASYLMNCKYANKTDLIGYNHFYGYLTNLYTTEFLNNKSSELRNIFDFSNDKERKNIEHILYLLISCQSSKFSYDKFLNHYKKCANYIDDIDTLLNETIETMNNKYGDYNGVIENISEYLNTGRKTLITRTNGLRDRILDSNFRVSLQKRLYDQNFSLNDYIQRNYNYETKAYH